MNYLQTKRLLLATAAVLTLLLAGIVALPLASEAAPSLAPPPPITGAISGHVYQADGVTPIANAWVYALDTNYQFVAEDHSQTDGSYQIGGIPSGSHYVVVQAAGYGGVYYDNGYDDPHATPVEVAAPNTTPNIDFRLSPEATLSGYVYDNDGTTPIGGATVQVWPHHGGQIRQSTTIADGSCSVGGLSTGYYVAKVEAADYALEFYDDRAGWSTATPI